MSVMSPQMIVRHIRNGNVARAAVVHERNHAGEVISRVLDVQDVEARSDECKEIVVVDETTERKILKTLRLYRYSLLYLAVMVTIGILLLVIDIFFN